MKKRLLPLLLTLILIAGLFPAGALAADTNTSITFQNNRDTITGTPDYTVDIKGHKTGTLIRLNNEGNETEDTGFLAGCYNYHVYMDKRSTIAFTTPGPSISGAKITLRVDDVLIANERSTFSQANGLWKPKPTPSETGTKIELILKNNVDPENILTYTFTVFGVDTTIQDAVISDLSIEPADRDNLKWDTAEKSGSYHRLYVPTGAESATVTFETEPGVKLYAGSVAEGNELQKDDAENYIYTASAFQDWNIERDYTYPTKIIACTENAALGIKKETAYNFAFVSRGELPYTNGIKVKDYAPAAGQFIRRVDIKNGEADFLLVPTTRYSKYISLGSFGGYMDFEFETPITNDPDNPYGIDFLVYGNGFAYANVNSPELGNVMVSEDGKDWYTLAGSRHYELETQWDAPATLLDQTTIKAVLIAKTGVGGVTRAPFAVFGYADYHNSSGSGDNAETLYTVNSIVGNSPYAASHVNNLGDGFDLAWAVDAAGRPIKLDSVKYVRVQTAVDIHDPSLGENSVEIGTLTKVVKNSGQVGVSKAPSSITINGIDVLAKEPTAAIDSTNAKYYEIDLNNKSLAIAEVKVRAQGSNISINNEIFANSADYIGLLAADGSRMVRIIVQDYNKEPLIYVFKLTGGGDPATNADLSGITLTPGDVHVKAAQAADGTYQFNVAFNVEKIKLAVNALNPTASIELKSGEKPPILLKSGQATDPLAIAEGKNTYAVTVKSTDGTTTKHYTIEVIRALSSGENADDGMITVYFTFTGDAIHGHTNDNPPQPKPGHEVQTWIKRTEIKIPKGSTVKYLTDMMLYNAGIQFDDTNGTYIAKVWHPTENKWLGEFDNGKNSGWMYRQNGIIAGEGYSIRILHNGDDILWFYTDDYTKETGYEGNWDEVNQGGDSKEGSVILSPKVTIKDGVAAATISSTEMSTVIADAKKSESKTITIAPEITGKAAKATVELPKSALSEVAAETKADLQIVTPTGSVTIPNDVLASVASQAGGSTVTIALEAVETKSLTVEQQKTVGNSAVFDISIFSGGKSISSFGGKSITVSLPYTLKTGEKAEGIAVWYLNDAGKLERMACKYDQKTGLVTFTTSHLSHYVVGYEAWTNPFADVKAEDWFYDAVKYAVQKELFTGTSTTTFAPNADMTRAMLVTVLYRMEGKPAVTGTNAFTDVNPGEWYTDAILWANEKKLVEGYGDRLFGTNDPITREQMAAILYRYAQMKDYSTTKTAQLTKFTDAKSVSEWANSAIKWAVAEGLISGTTTDTLAPGGTATRAQVATILMRFLESKR